MPKSKDNEKKPGMDPEVTRVVLIFLLLLVIIALLVAAFMSLGGAASEDPNPDHVLQIEVPTDDNGEEIPTEAPTEDPNHNSQTDPIPEEVLNPTEEETVDPNLDVPPIETENTIAPEPETEMGEIPKMTAGGDRPAETTPVYMSTESELATLAPPLTTAGDGSNPTTPTATVSDAGGEAVTVNYTVSLSGTAGIYAEPGGSSNGTVGSNGTFTIVQEKTDASGVKWGKLKSGAGWVRLN